MRSGADGIATASRNVVTMRAELADTLRELTLESRSVSRLAEFLERRPDAILSGRESDGGGR